jgi:glycosyltransferase involved in cell wall biosynthesis
MNSKIAWLVPKPIKGSGGIREIYNKIQHLCNQGHECHAFVEGDANVYQLADQIESFYGPNDCVLHSGWEHNADEFDMIFSTIWYSAREVAKAPARVKKAYMIQDYEAWFNPMGDGYLWAEESYQLGLHPVCLGRWLPNVLHRQFGATSHFFDFCCERQLYFQTRQFDQRELAVCYIYQPEKPRRCSQIGIQALTLLKREMPDVTIYLYGSDEIGKVPFPHVNLGILRSGEINDLYNRCSLGFCMSSSNPSRIPFEMMSAGLPVVDIHRENNLFDFPEAGVLLAADNARAIARALVQCLSDHERLRAMSAFGIEWMSQRSMQREYDQFYSAVQSILQGNGHTVIPELPGRIYQKNAVKGDL